MEKRFGFQALDTTESLTEAEKYLLNEITAINAGQTDDKVLLNLQQSKNKIKDGDILPVLPLESVRVDALKVE